MGRLYHGGSGGGKEVPAKAGVGLFFLLPFVGEGGEMRFGIEPDEGYPLTLPSPTRGEGLNT